MWLGLGIKDDFFLHINFAKIGYCNVNFEPFFLKKKFGLKSCLFVCLCLRVFMLMLVMYLIKWGLSMKSKFKDFLLL